MDDREYDSLSLWILWSLSDQGKKNGHDPDSM